MAKKVPQDINQIFDDLDKLRDFCRDHGFRFVEADLYNPRMFVWHVQMLFYEEPCIPSKAKKFHY